MKFIGKMILRDLSLLHQVLPTQINNDESLNITFKYLYTFSKEYRLYSLVVLGSTLFYNLFK